jgi:hypothetical protein
MLTSKIVVALSVSLVAAGIYQASAQRREADAALTALDYAQIERLYGAYNRALDVGEADGLDYAALYVPDGMMINVFRVPASGACRVNSTWRLGGREAIRGSFADRRGAKNVCISRLDGAQDFATMAKDFHVSGTQSLRHVHANLTITPAPGGAAGFVYFTTFDVATQPPTLSSSGFYEDVLVRTSGGWRFKKRIRLEDVAMSGPSKS